jgi:hypothetical protein
LIGLREYFRRRLTGRNLTAVRGVPWRLTRAGPTTWHRHMHHSPPHRHDVQRPPARAPCLQATRKHCQNTPSSIVDHQKPPRSRPESSRLISQPPRQARYRRASATTPGIIGGFCRNAQTRARTPPRRRRRWRRQRSRAIESSRRNPSLPSLSYFRSRPEQAAFERLHALRRLISSRRGVEPVAS